MALPPRPAEPSRFRQRHYELEDGDEQVEPGPLDVFTVGSQEPLAYVDLGDVFINDKAVLREVEVLSRRSYTLKVSLAWEQAVLGAGAVVAS
ncbi:unnamed protein product, partial [Pylaiella littoralis]